MPKDGFRHFGPVICRLGASTAATAAISSQDLDVMREILHFFLGKDAKVRRGCCPSIGGIPEAFPGELPREGR